MGGSPPSTPTPQESAKAQAQSEVAGQMLSTATTPTVTYAEVLSRLESDPTYQKINAANANNSARDTAKGTQAVNAMANPYGSAVQGMTSRVSSQRLATVLGQPTGAGLTQSNTQGAFDYPSPASLPNLDDITTQSKAIANTLPSVSFGHNGDVALNYPNVGNQPHLADAINRATSSHLNTGTQFPAPQSPTAQQQAPAGMTWDPNRGQYVPDPFAAYRAAGANGVQHLG